MRILNVIMCLDPIAGGGAVERIYQLSKYLVESGEQCTILTTRQGWDDEHARKLGNVEVVALPYLSERYRIPLGQPAWLRKHLGEFDVVHLALNWTAINALTYVFLRSPGRPYALSAMGWLAIDGRSRALKRVYRAAFTRRMVRDASACVAITQREVADYLEYGVDPGRISRIPNGFIPEAFNERNDDAFRARYGIDSRPIILFIGRLDPIKGPDLLLRAFQRVSKAFPEHQLIIAGNDLGFRSQLEALSRALGVEKKVSFFGHIGGLEKAWAYHAADVFAVPSRFDTMTIVALEAAACGTPVLMTDRVDFDELQEAGGGLTVECSVEGLERGLLLLLGDPVRLKSMGERARSFARNHYGWEQIGKRFVEVFRTACSAAPRESRSPAGIE